MPARASRCEKGRAYVTGFTSTVDYPTTSGAFDTTYNLLSLMLSLPS